jgi:hypothetical protein
MGYTTDFDGSVTLEPALTPEQAAYLKRFNQSRRMKRNAEIAETFPDPLREAVGLPIGVEGEFYVSSEDLDGVITDPNDPRIGHLKSEKVPEWNDPSKACHAGQRRDASIDEYNGPPSGQPSLWCQWTTNADGTEIEWDGGEKFYEYVEWMEYIIDSFLKPWGIVAEGEIEWQGEGRGDIGLIVVKDNVVNPKMGRIVFDD